MIAPNMATMLAFVATDIALSVSDLRHMMPTIADASFNGVHVDSHPSTNDTFMVFSVPKSSASHANAQSMLTRVAKRLAWLIARDGEGATKVTTIVIRGAQNEQAAKTVARDIATSALVRTAIFGNDPNWGRFVSQVGNSHAVNSVLGLRCWIAGHLVFEHGQPAKFDRQQVSKAMQNESIELVIELTEGAGSYELMTADLGYRYVEINAEYTT
jgi:glutamate N-acetyltransferase/amino-acid N-acetyltransferase